MPELQKMNLKQLRELARERNLPNRSKMRKAELVMALVATEGAPEAITPATPQSAEPRVDVPLDVNPIPSSLIEQTPAEDFGPNGDPGLPLPERYGRDMVVLMVQDPEHLYAWWELSGTGLNELNAAIGGGASVLIIDGPNGQEQREVDFTAGNYYFAVSPTSSYSVSLALRDRAGNLHILVRSQAVVTPASGASDRLDEEWMAVDETFTELLNRAQLGGDEHPDQLSSAERLRQQHTKSWSTTTVTPLFSGNIMGNRDEVNAPSSLSLSSNALYSGELTKKRP